MELSGADQNYLSELEAKGGKEWEQFRARRNQWMRKGKEEDWATWRSLQTAKQNNVIQFNVSETTRSFTSEDWVKVYICIGIWIPLVIYQLTLHTETFGSGIEGFFVAVSLEIILAFLSILQLNNIHQELLRWSGVLCLGAFMAFSVIGVTQKKVIEADPAYKRYQEQYARMEENYNQTSEKSISARRKLIENMAETNQKLLEIESKSSGIGFGINISDLNMQIRLIFLGAQIIVSHVLGTLLFGRNAP